MSKQSKELRGFGKEELGSRLMELRKELVKLNQQIATGTVFEKLKRILYERRLFGLRRKVLALALPFLHELFDGSHDRLQAKKKIAAAAIAATQNQGSAWA